MLQARIASIILLFCTVTVHVLLPDGAKVAENTVNYTLWKLLNNVRKKTVMYSVRNGEI